MEEFHVSPDFVGWFSRRVGTAEGQFDGAWHSVTDADGETDLLLRVSEGSGRIGILIENKVSAPEQILQDERYHLRAARAQNAGRFHRFVVCICAPRAYLDGLSAASAYQAQVAYEEIAEWFASKDDARSRWRCAIMNEAIVQGRRGYRMIVNETVSQFHQEFWGYVQGQHPELLMRRPTPKGNKSNWIIFKGVGFPKGVGFHVKMDQRTVELGFVGRTVAELRGALPALPTDIRTVQKGGTAALAISTPFLDRTKKLKLQEEALVATMQAVARLYPFSSPPNLAVCVFSSEMVKNGAVSVNIPLSHFMDAAVAPSSSQSSQDVTIRKSSTYLE
ncbi:PD-(D/E)XK nuclease family protein [Qipengyuania spongiae]